MIYFPFRKKNSTFQNRNLEILPSSVFLNERRFPTTLWSLSNYFHNINQLHLEIRFTESKANAPFYPKGHLRCLRGVEKTSLPVTLWSLPEWTKKLWFTAQLLTVPTDTSTSRTSFHSLRKVSLFYIIQKLLMSEAQKMNFRRDISFMLGLFSETHLKTFSSPTEKDFFFYFSCRLLRKKGFELFCLMMLQNEETVIESKFIDFPEIFRK